MLSEHMRRALALAEDVLGTTSPNPSVGCVIVRDGQVAGEGATLPPGQAHAEVVALRAGGELALTPVDHPVATTSTMRLVLCPRTFVPGSVDSASWCSSQAP